MGTGRPRPDHHRGAADGELTDRPYGRSDGTIARAPGLLVAEITAKQRNECLGNIARFRTRRRRMAAMAVSRGQKGSISLQNRHRYAAAKRAKSRRRYGSIRRTTNQPPGVAAEYYGAASAKGRPAVPYYRAESDSPAMPAAMLRPVCAWALSGCSTMVLREPPISALAPTPPTTVTSPETPP